MHALNIQNAAVYFLCISDGRLYFTHTRRILDYLTLQMKSLWSVKYPGLLIRHSSTPQKTWIFSNATVRTSDLPVVVLIGICARVLKLWDAFCWCAAFCNFEINWPTDESPVSFLTVWSDDLIMLWISRHSLPVLTISFLFLPFPLPPKMFPI